MSIVPSIPNRGVKSFSRRIGRSLSNRQQKLVNEHLSHYTLKNKTDLDHTKHIYLEIGFGMGDHFIYQAVNNPDRIFVGAEVYMNGVVRTLDQIVNKNIGNALLYPDDVNILVNDISLQGSFEGIYILFPDPWPKKRHLKRRMVNAPFLNLLSGLIKPGGFLVFGSDISDYYNEVKALLESSPRWEQNELTFSDLSCTTKYYQKALTEGRKSQFLCYRVLKRINDI